MRTSRTLNAKRGVLGALLLLLGASASVSCKRAAAPRGTGAAGAGQVGYPHGPWWRSDLRRVLVCSEHILLTYEGTEVATGVELMTPVPVHRSQADALSRALNLSARLKEHPDEFEDVAARESEDAATKSLRGALGCAPVGALPATVVDALGNLEYDEVSDVVPSALGYHIVKRVREPAEHPLAAQEILILHRDAATAKFWSAASAARRSREDAQKLAAEVRSQALAEPDSFGSLADAKSDYEMNAHGDYGVWSNRDMDADPRVVTILEHLPINGISGVIEDRDWGFHVYKRVEPTPRRLFAHRAMAVRYEAGEGALEKARAEAQVLLADALAHPSLFDEHPDHYCAGGNCVGPFTYTEGRAGIPNLTTELDAIPMGGVLPHTVEVPGAVEVVQRTEPRVVRPLADRFTLPRPERPTLSTASADEFASYLEYYAKHVHAELHLPDDQFAKFLEIVQNLGKSVREAPRAQWPALVEESRKRTLAALGPKTAKELNDFDAALQLSLLGELKRKQM